MAARPLSRSQWIQVEGLSGDPRHMGVRSSGDRRLTFGCRPFRARQRIFRSLPARGRPGRARCSRELPATPGFLKAVTARRFAGLASRLLPGQPSAESLGGARRRPWNFTFTIPWWRRRWSFFIPPSLGCAALRPVRCGVILEEVPQSSRSRRRRWEDPCLARNPAAAEPRRETFALYLGRLLDRAPSARPAPWQTLCEGYFKWPTANTRARA